MPAVPAPLPGLHHVTAITADAQKNIDFYSRLLGLRLVKLTVNFDDPTSYHLYYGDELGRPGTVMTFFAWPGALRGQVGPPQVSATAFAVPLGALPYWAGRLKQHDIRAEPFTRFDEHGLSFTDPDDLRLEIIATENPGGQPWAAGPVTTEHALRGFHSVTLSEEGYEFTAGLLAENLGFSAGDSLGNRFRYRTAHSNGFAAIVDLICTPDAPRSRTGAGIVHHVAFRTPDDAAQNLWRQRIVALRLNVSPVMDRNYFHSIYFREPGGVLFEIATESPGFTVDEPAEQLGSTLQLPPQFAPHRSELERLLPALRLP